LRLRKFRVRAFRCIHDSGDITVRDLAAFVGRNESGKTTILQALTLLNKDEIASDLDLCDEMVEDLKSEVKLAEGEFQLNKNEINMIKEKFPSIEISKIKIFRTNKEQEIQYNLGDIKFEQDENTGLKSWKNLSVGLLDFVDTIPNHIRQKLDTRFFEGRAPNNKEIFKTNLIAFNNNILAAASQEHQVISDWKEFYDKIMGDFDNILINSIERIELEEFLKDNLHPRFVYFSDYKKILGNINLNEYLTSPTDSEAGGVEYLEEFDRSETVRNLLYLAELELRELEECQSSPSKLIKLLNTASRKLTERLNPS